MASDIAGYLAKGQTVCKDHLREVCNFCLVETEDLEYDSMCDIVEAIADGGPDGFDRLRSHANWAHLFQPPADVARDSDSLSATCAFVARPRQLHFDRRAALESVFPGAYDQFRQSGIVAVDVASWLIQEGALYESLLNEIRAIHHHTRILGKPGWMRTNSHLIVQQLFRMDPIVHLLASCLAPSNRCTDLIAVPNFVYYATRLDETFFQIDPQDIERDESEDSIPIVAISLLDEDVDSSCTMAAPLSADGQQRTWIRYPLKAGQAIVLDRNTPYGFTSPHYGHRIVVIVKFVRAVAGSPDWTRISTLNNLLLPGD